MKTKNISKALVKLCLFTGLMFGSAGVYAQLPGFLQQVDDETPPVPIDGLIGAAALVGAFYGSKKLKNK